MKGIAAEVELRELDWFYPEIERLLTDRGQRIVQLCREGKRRSEIAEVLDVTPLRTAQLVRRTIKSYRVVLEGQRDTPKNFYYRERMG